MSSASISGLWLPNKVRWRVTAGNVPYVCKLAPNCRHIRAVPICGRCELPLTWDR